MDRPTGTALLDHFAALEDPRQVAKVLYYCCVTGHTKSLIQLPFLSRTSARIVERGQWVSPARDTAVVKSSSAMRPAEGQADLAGGWVLEQALKPAVAVHLQGAPEVGQVRGRVL